jgi:hypothetical protein
VEIVSGRASVQASLVAYHSQSAFIMNATVRDNILFGHVNDPVVDEELYRRAVDACALRHDFDLLPYGDATEIGEKGVTLSGGKLCSTSFCTLANLLTYAFSQMRRSEGKSSLGPRGVPPGGIDTD